MFFQDMLMKLAKAVATAAATLVLKAKNVAQKTEDSAQQNRVIAAATQCALSTSQLVACTRVRKKNTLIHRQLTPDIYLFKPFLWFWFVQLCFIIIITTE